MLVSCLQFNPVWEDAQANVTQLIRLFETYITQQKAQDAPHVVVLPELFHSGFSMNVQAIKQDRDGLVYGTLKKLAKTYSVTLIAGVALKTKDDSKALNSAIVFDINGNEQACYIKNYAFSYAGEQHHYTEGAKQVVFWVGHTPCTVFICYDLRFADLFNALATQVEVMFVIASWPASRQMHWQTLLTARAIENQCYVVGVNRVGQDNAGLAHEGGSTIINPMGESVCLMNQSQMHQSIELDLTSVTETRQQFPFLKDRK